jgi:hypothetical protein
MSTKCKTSATPPHVRCSTICPPYALGHTYVHRIPLNNTYVRNMSIYYTVYHRSNFFNESGGFLDHSPAMTGLFNPPPTPPSPCSPAPQQSGGPVAQPDQERRGCPFKESLQLSSFKVWSWRLIILK